MAPHTARRPGKDAPVTKPRKPRMITRTTTEEVEAPEEEQELPLQTAAVDVQHDDELNPDARKMLDDLDAIDGEGFARISRQLPNGDVAFLRKIPRPMLAENPKIIGETWGAGKYYIELFNDSTDPQQRRGWVRKFFLLMDRDEFGPPKGVYSSSDTVPQGAEVYRDLHEAPVPLENTYAPQVLGEDGQPVHQPAFPPTMMGILMMQIQQQGKDNAAAAQRNHELELERIRAAGRQNPEGGLLDQIAKVGEIVAKLSNGGGNHNKLADRVMDAALGKMLDKDDVPPVSVDTEGMSPLMQILMPVVAPLAAAFGKGLAQAQVSGAPPLSLRTANPTAPARPAPVSSARIPMKAEAGSPAAVAAAAAPVPAPPAPEGEGTPGVQPDPNAVVEEQPAHPAYGGASDETSSREAPMSLVQQLLQNTAVASACSNFLEMAEDGLDPIDAATAVDARVGLVGKKRAIVDQLIDKTPDELVDYLCQFEHKLFVYAPWIKEVQKELLQLREEAKTPVPAETNGHAGAPAAAAIVEPVKVAP